MHYPQKNDVWRNLSGKKIVVTGESINTAQVVFVWVRNFNESQYYPIELNNFIVNCIFVYSSTEIALLEKAFSTMRKEF